MLYFTVQEVQTFRLLCSFRQLISKSWSLYNEDKNPCKYMRIESKIHGCIQRQESPLSLSVSIAQFQAHSRVLTISI